MAAQFSFFVNVAATSTQQKLPCALDYKGWAVAPDF